jgi:hypothetical protein
MMPTNVFSDWFTDVANSMSESFANTRVEIVKQLARTSLPTVDQLHNQWYLLGLGGTYGLASKFVLLVVLLTALVIIFTPLSNHSLRVRRTAQSFLVVGLFGVLFFPIYSLLYNLVQGACQGMINVALGKSSSSLDEAAAAMLAVLLPGDVWFKVIVSFIGMIFAYLAFAVALTNYLAVLGTSMVYPLAVAFRPVAEKFNALFHGANSAVITTLSTPIVITIGFLMPTFAARMIPGVGGTGIAAGIFTVIGVLVAFFGPIAVAVFAFKGSNRVFGQLDFGSISGTVGVDSMPPITSRDMDNSVKESGFKAFTSSMIPGAATANLSKSDDLMGDVKKLAVEGVSAAAAATGHPWVAGALNAVDTTLTKEKRAHQGEGHASMPPPTGQPMGESGPMPTQPAGSSSPVKEWPDHK